MSMAKQSDSNWKYCDFCVDDDDNLNQHKCCIESLNKILSRDKGPSNFFNDKHNALNIDKVEDSLAKIQRRSKRKTMDLALTVGKKKQRKYCLAEIKYDVKNPFNIKRSEIEDKFNGTTNIISSSKLFSSRYYIFKKSYVSQGENLLRRHNLNKKGYISCDLTTFKNEFFEDN